MLPLTNSQLDNASFGFDCGTTVSGAVTHTIGIATRLQSTKRPVSTCHVRNYSDAFTDSPPVKLLSILTGQSRHMLLLPPVPSASENRVLIKPTDLPDEVLLSIFQYLTSARDIAAVRGVCFAWRKLVDRTAFIWRSIVFDLPKRPTSAHHAESWYRKAADFGNAQAQVRFLLSHSTIFHITLTLVGILTIFQL